MIFIIMSTIKHSNLKHIHDIIPEHVIIFIDVQLNYFYDIL